MREIKGTKGVSIIEVVVTAVIVGIIASLTGSILVSVTQVYMTIPEQARAQMIAQQIVDTIVDGDAGFNGLRYATTIVNATAGQCDYNAGPSPTAVQSEMWNISIQYSSSEGKLSRSAVRPSNPVSYSIFPSWIAANNSVFIAGESPPDNTLNNPGTFFRYYDEAGNQTTTLSQIRRIDIFIAVWSGEQQAATNRRGHLIYTLRHSIFLNKWL